MKKLKLIILHLIFLSGIFSQEIVTPDSINITHPNPNIFRHDSLILENGSISVFISQFKNGQSLLNKHVFTPTISYYFDSRYVEIDSGYVPNGNGWVALEITDAIFLTLSIDKPTILKLETTNGILKNIDLVFRDSADKPDSMHLTETYLPFIYRGDSIFLQQSRHTSQIIFYKNNHTFPYSSYPKPIISYSNGSDFIPYTGNEIYVSAGNKSIVLEPKSPITIKVDIGDEFSIIRHIKPREPPLSVNTNLKSENGLNSDKAFNVKGERNFKNTPKYYRLILK